MLEAGFTPAQCRAAREAIGWSQERLAKEARVSRPVVQDFERRKRVPLAPHIRQIKAALEAVGVAFQREPARSGITFPDNEGSTDD